MHKVISLVANWLKLLWLVYLTKVAASYSKEMQGMDCSKHFMFWIFTKLISVKIIRCYDSLENG